MKKIMLIISCIMFSISCFFYIYIENELDKTEKKYDKKEKHELKNEIDSIKLEIMDDLEDNLKNENIDTLINNIDQYIEEKNQIIADNEIKKNNLNDQKKTLTKKYNNLVEEYNRKQEEKRKIEEQKRIAEQKKIEAQKSDEEKKSTFILSNVPTLNQYSAGYPTGCESAALTLLLRYNGVNINISEVVKLLKKGDIPHYENNVLYGGNPYIEFIGEPTSINGLGSYEKPILEVASNFKSGIVNGTGNSLSDVLKIVKSGKPVVVWTSLNLKLPYISKTWIYKPTNEKISWSSGEHVVLLVGYNDNNVIVSDPSTGTIMYYDRSTFENRYNYYGKRAIYY